MEVAQHKGVGLHCGGLDDAVEHDPLAIVLQNSGRDELGAVMGPVAFSHLEEEEWEKERKDDVYRTFGWLRRQ